MENQDLSNTRKESSSEEKHKIWKFVSNEDFIHKTKILEGVTCEFEWLKIEEDGTITVKGSYGRGYAWDGCTPKWNAIDITWGNFDGKLFHFGKGNYKPYTYYASMIHDVLYQYKRSAPISRKEADDIFYEVLKNTDFMWSRTYYIGVRMFGWIFPGWQSKAKINSLRQKGT